MLYYRKFEPEEISKMLSSKFTWRWFIDTKADDFFLIKHFYNLNLFERHLFKLHFHLLANIFLGSILI